MKLVDIAFGQKLTDKDGNIFEVVDIDRMDDDLPVCLELVKHVKDFGLPKNDYEVFEVEDDHVGSEFWIELKLTKQDREGFTVPCVDLHSLKIFEDVEVPNELDEPDEQNAPEAQEAKTSEVSKPAIAVQSDNRSHLQTKAVEEAEELYDIVHDMFVLPRPEEMRLLVKQHQLDDVFQVIRDAARRGEQEVNLPQGDIDGIGGVLIAAGYQVYFTGHPQRCYVRW